MISVSGLMGECRGGRRAWRESAFGEARGHVCTVQLSLHHLQTNPSDVEWRNSERSKMCYVRNLAMSDLMVDWYLCLIVSVRRIDGTHYTSKRSADFVGHQNSNP